MSTVSQMRQLDKAQPVYLVEIQLQNSGPTLYLSQMNIVVGSQRYEDYIETVEGIGSELRRADSGGLNSTAKLRFKNLPFMDKSYLIELADTYPFEGSTCRISEAYISESGQVSDSIELIRCVLEEPRQIDLMGFTCMCSSHEFYADINR